MASNCEEKSRMSSYLMRTAADINKTTLLFAGIAVFVWAVMCLATEENIIFQDKVREAAQILIGRVPDSEVEMLVNNLSGRDPVAAQSAVRMFAELGAIKAVALALQYPASSLVQIEAAKYLKEKIISQARDIAMLIVQALEKANPDLLFLGGSEARIENTRLRIMLIDLICEATGLDRKSVSIEDPVSVKKFIAAARKDLFPSEQSKSTPESAPTEADSAYPFLKPDEIAAKAKIAVAAETPPKERFMAVWGLAISGYTKESAEALSQVACGRSAGENTRDYAAMGLGNFTRQLPEESRKMIQQRLRAVFEKEKDDTPDGIIRTLIGWNDAPFIRKVLGKQMKGHTLDVEILAALPGKEGCDSLWQLYQKSPKGYKSVYSSRKERIGRALIDKNDVRGIDILIDLLSEDHVPDQQYRQNAFIYLMRKLNNNFGYNAENFDAALEKAIPEMVYWWKKNKKTFVLGTTKAR
jgi:hypothetical protein